MSHAYLFVLLIVASTGFACNVSVFKKVDHKGPSEKVPDDKCTNLRKLAGQVRSVKLGAVCLRFYKNRRCSGSFIELHPHSPATNDLRHWNFSDKITSVGPCPKKCHNAENDRARDSPDITLHTESNYSGAVATVKLEGCTQIPLSQVNSINTNGYCVMLYDTSHCGKGVDNKFIEVRPDDPFHNNLARWGNRWGGNFQKKVINHCSYQCEPSKVPIEWRNWAKGIKNY